MYSTVHLITHLVMNWNVMYHVYYQTLIKTYFHDKNLHRYSNVNFIQYIFKYKEKRETFTQKLWIIIRSCLWNWFTLWHTLINIPFSAWWQKSDRLQILWQPLQFQQEGVDLYICIRLRILFNSTKLFFTFGLYFSISSCYTWPI
jgi:hypothetical protein